ncbi:UNVERIFIED_ORG: hypothetical protein J2W19_003866 [Shinella zoogloeoides]|nr:hypothetical protein [Shinella zoogloeoides]
MDDSAAILFFRRGGRLLRAASLLTVLAALAGAGCAARPGAGVDSMSTTVPATSALVLPAPGTLSIVSVIQRQYTNAIEQQIALSTTAATSGQNFISIQAFGPAETVARPAGALAFKPVQQGAIRGEIRKYFPGRQLVISTNFVRNSYGPFGYAYGRGAGDDGCLYGWQQVRSDVSDRDRLRELGMLQIRLRVCQSGASERELVELMYGYTVVGGFAGVAWNPYGRPAPVDSQIGGGEPLRPVFEEPTTTVATPTRNRAVVTRRTVAETPVRKTQTAVDTSGNAVVVPSPSGGATVSGGEAVVVPSPVCATGEGGAASCN